MHSRKVIMITLLVLAALLAGWFLFRWIVSSGVAVRKLKTELVKLVEQGSDGLYALEIGSIKVVPEQLQVHLYEVKLVPDEARYKELMTRGEAAPDLFSFQADKLTINNLPLADFLADKTIRLQSVELHKVLVEVLHSDSLTLAESLGENIRENAREKGLGKTRKNMEEKGRENGSTKGAEDIKQSTVQSARDTAAKGFDPGRLYERIRKDVRKIAVDTILFSSFDLRYINRTNKSDTTWLRNLNVFAEDFLLDDSSYMDASRFLFTRTLVVQSWEFEAPLKNEHYKLKFDTLRMVIAGNTHTTIRNLHLQPIYSEAEYSERVKTQLERFNVSVPSLRMVNFQYNELLQNGLIVADSLLLRNAYIGVYKDRSKAFDGKTRLGKYPHQLLRHSGLPVDVNVCVLSGSDIVYRERSEQTNQTGEVKFTGTSAVVKPIRNRKNTSEPVYVDADTKFMGTTPLKAAFVLYPGSPDGDFSVRADFAPLDLKDLNKATIHLGEVRIDTGKVEELKFHIRGNDHFSTTDLRFRYSGLKASLLKKEDGETYRKRNFLSMVANAFILKTDNRKREQHVVVRYQRDTNKSMFNLIWKGVFAGMKEIAGAGALGKDRERVTIVSKD